MSSETGITALVAHAVAGFPAIFPAGRGPAGGAVLEGEVLRGSGRHADTRRGIVLDQSLAGPATEPDPRPRDAVARPRMIPVRPEARQAAAFYLANAVSDLPRHDIDLFV